MPIRKRKKLPLFVVVAQQAILESLECDMTKWTRDEQTAVYRASLNVNPKGDWSRWDAWGASIEAGRRVLRERERRLCKGRSL